MVTVALVGIGRWGQQLLRVLDSRSRVVWGCHRGNPAVRPWLKEHYPQIECTVNYDDVLQDRRVEAVVLATPIATHATLARRALEAGKHLFVEKPLATTSAEADLLTSLATSRGLVLFAGHVFLYHPVLERITHLTQHDPIRDAVMRWEKPGTFEEDLFWNLASHEISIAMTLFHARPTEATVLFERGLVTACDVALARLRFEGGRECAIQINRCAAIRSKTVTMITDSGRVLCWDQNTLYTLNDHQRYEVEYASEEEPLAREVEAFLRRVGAKASTPDDTVSGRRVVGVIEQLMAHRARSRFGRESAAQHAANGDRAQETRPVVRAGEPG